MDFGTVMFFVGMSIAAFLAGCACGPVNTSSRPPRFFLLYSPCLLIYSLSRCSRYWPSGWRLASFHLGLHQSPIARSAVNQFPTPCQSGGLTMWRYAVVVESLWGPFRLRRSKMTTTAVLSQR